MSASPSTKTKPAPEQLAPEKRAQILAGAKSVFSEVGYETASMDLIARRAGVSKGTLYNHFMGKEVLFTAYVQAECRAQTEAIFTMEASDAPPEEVLRQVGAGLMKLILSPMGMAIRRGVLAEAPRFPELGRMMEASGPGIGIRRLGGYLRRATEAGWLQIEDPEYAAEYFLALCSARVLRKLEFGLVAEISPAQQAEAVERAVAFFLRASRPR